MSLATQQFTELTVREIADRVGDIPFGRIRWNNPPPGSAGEHDVERIRCDEGRLFELIDGVLVEKAVSEETAILAAEMIRLLGNFVKPRRLGWIVAPDGFYRLFGTRLRAPDASFVRRDQRPDGHPIRKGYPDVAPALVVEIVSPGNTREELERKRDEFFSAGTELCWNVSPERREIVVSTSPTAHETLSCSDVLDGGVVLPGFSVSVAEIFEALDLSHPGT